MYSVFGLILLLVLSGLPEAYAQVLSDPMQPPPFALKKFRQAAVKNKPGPSVTLPVKQKFTPVSLKLTSILFSNSRRIAIIDDQLLRVGDSISGAKLVKINKNNVRLLRKGKIINLSLSHEMPVIKKSVAENKL